MVIKRYIKVILPILVAFSLAGCAKRSSNSSNISTNFNGTINVKTLDKEYKCQLSHTPERTSRLEITSPNELSGLTFLWENGKYNVCWKELMCELTKQFLGEKAFAETIVEILDFLSENQELSSEKSSNKNEEVYTGKCPCGGFKIKTDKNGVIKSISVPEKNIECEFIEN